MDTETRQRAAKRLLINYFGAAWKAAGLQWDSDNVAEVGAIIEILFEEIGAQCAAVDERRERLAAHKRAVDLDIECETARRSTGPTWGTA